MKTTMKTTNTILLLLFAGSFCLGQTISISGTVKDQHGQPVPLAFVRDMQHYYATFADSTGTYVLKADPSSVLIAIAPNYNDVKVKIDNKSGINIVMEKGASSSAGTLTTLAANGSDNNSSFLNNMPVANQNGFSTKVQEGFNQEPTKGSRYLFTNWVHGFATSTGDSLLYDVNNLYNYDKIDGDVLFTKDKANISKIDKAKVKSISLYDGKLYPRVFENAPTINNKAFVEVLISTPKYKVYKKMETKLVRANFHTDGVIESGHKYDEYTDAERYYFVKLPGGQPQSFSLKKSVVKKLFAGDADKYIDAHGDTDINDDYLRDLGYNLY